MLMHGGGGGRYGLEEGRGKVGGYRITLIGSVITISILKDQLEINKKLRAGAKKNSAGR